MDNAKRYILFGIPMSICNFRCEYCYLSQRDVSFQGIQPPMRYTPEQIAYALRQERTGGPCQLNICANGETLLVKNLDQIISLLLCEGHYAEIVTNLSLSKQLQPFLELDSKLLNHLTFKCSFHYLELKKRNLLQTFADNIHNIWNAGASASVEITPHDALIPYIDEIKQFSMDHFGALPHITIARDDRTSKIDRLTSLSLEEYNKIWRQFNSDLFTYKSSIFGIKQTKFCYAGQNSLYIDLTSGDTRACYFGGSIGNAFAEPEKPLPKAPVGRCRLPHCYNGHTLLTMGLIPDVSAPGYGDLRDRVRADGSHWMQPEMRAFMNTKLYDTNDRLPKAQEILCYSESLVKEIGGKAVRKFYAMRKK